MNHDLLIGWAAGFFEGEGTVSRRAGSHFIAINNTDLHSLERFHAAVGVGRVRGPYGPYNALSKKPHWTWSACKKGDRQVVTDLLGPLLSDRRIEQLAAVSDVTNIIKALP